MCDYLCTFVFLYHFIHFAYNNTLHIDIDKAAVEYYVA